MATIDVVAHTTTVDLKGWEGWKQYANMFLTAFPDLELTTEDLIAEGDKVVVRWSAHGTHRGPLRNLKPTGKHMKVTGVAIYRFVDNKVAEGWALNDTLGMMQQLGAIPS